MPAVPVGTWQTWLGDTSLGLDDTRYRPLEGHPFGFLELAAAMCSAVWFLGDAGAVLVDMNDRYLNMVLWKDRRWQVGMAWHSIA